MKEYRNIILCLGNGSSTCPPECPIFDLAEKISLQAKEHGAQKLGVSPDQVQFDLEKTEQAVQSYLATHPLAFGIIYEMCLRKIN